MAASPKHFFWLLFPAATFGLLVAACDGTFHRTQCVETGSCLDGTHWDPTSCSCVADPVCNDPGICGAGLQWDSAECRCVSTGHCTPLACEPPAVWVQSECQCAVTSYDGGPPPVCTLPNGYPCPPGVNCAVHESPTCDVVCTCSTQGILSCSGCIPNDAGPGVCYAPNGNTCAVGTECMIGFCPGGSEQFCLCGSDGQLNECSPCPLPPPPPPYDGGPGYCAGANGTLCSEGPGCIVSYCPVNGIPIECTCLPGGSYTDCSSCSLGDGGPPPPPIDAGPPSGCYFGNGEYCAAGTSCVIGYCADGVTPITCYCEGNGYSECTGGCGPGGLPDAGVADASADAR